MRDQPEARLHAKIFKALRDEGIFAFHPANGGKRGAREAMAFKAQGVVAGVPDLIIIHNGKVMGLEVKAPGRKSAVTPVQKAVHVKMFQAGAPVWVVDDFDEAMAVVRAWTDE